MALVPTSNVVPPWPEPFPNFAGYHFNEYKSKKMGHGMHKLKVDIVGQTVKIIGTDSIKRISFHVKTTLLEVPKDASEHLKNDMKLHYVEEVTGEVDIERKAIKVHNTTVVSGKYFAHYVANPRSEIVLSADNKVWMEEDTTSQEGYQPPENTTGIWFLFAEVDHKEICPKLAPAKRSTAMEEMLKAFKDMEGKEMYRADEKRSIICDVHWLSLSKISTLEETFRSKVRITLRWLATREDVFSRRMHPLDWSPSWTPPRLGVSNSSSSAEDTTSMRERTPELRMTDSAVYVEKVLIINGTFSEPFELQSFPFDLQPLSILLHTAEGTTDDVEVVPGNITADEKCVASTEWKKAGCSQKWDRESTDKFFTGGKVGWTLEFTMHVRRNPYVFIVRIVGVMTLVGALPLCIFQLDGVNDLADRMSNSITLLLTAVAYSLVVAGSLPALGYLTFLDKYVLAILMFISLVIVQMAMIGGLEPDDAASWDWYCFYFDTFVFVFGLIITMMAICWKVRQAQKEENKSVGSSSSSADSAKLPGRGKE